MKAFWQKVKMRFAQFMQGRHGPDELSITMMYLAVLVSLIFSFSGVFPLYLLGLVLWIWCFYRIFSKKEDKRRAENRKFLETTSSWKREIKQFFVRLKNFRVYKYFRCPGCKARMRLSRGSGEKEIKCPRCGTTFKMKA